LLEEKAESESKVYTLDELEYAEPAHLTVKSNEFLRDQFSMREYKIIELQDLNVDDSAFDSISYLFMPHWRRIIYHNEGKTPLRIRGSCFTILTEDEWEYGYHKSDTLLQPKLARFDEWDIWEVDYVVKSGVIDTSRIFRSPKYISKKEIDTYLKTDSLMTVYWVSYIEYSDFFSNIYNALLIDNETYKFYNRNGLLSIGSQGGSREIYRWDVNLK
jgi:hypothetical protein